MGQRVKNQTNSPYVRKWPCTSLKIRKYLGWKIRGDCSRNYTPAYNGKKWGSLFWGESPCWNAWNVLNIRFFTDGTSSKSINDEWCCARGVPPLIIGAIGSTSAFSVHVCRIKSSTFNFVFVHSHLWSPTPERTSNELTWATCRSQRRSLTLAHIFRKECRGGHANFSDCTQRRETECPPWCAEVFRAGQH